jgi:hypothetical protein
MHERQAALIGTIAVLTFLAAAPVRAEKDAATKAQEGEINHWIEYYRKDREPAAAPPATPQDGAVSEEEREKRKEERGKQRRKGSARCTARAPRGK